MLKDKINNIYINCYKYNYDTINEKMYDKYLRKLKLVLKFKAIFHFDILAHQYFDTFTGQFFLNDEDKLIINEVSGLIVDFIVPTISVEFLKLRHDMLMFNYVHKRRNLPDAYWKEGDYFTLPKQISQNFIMSDFRAMVVGGAHFDNSCFIKGTSSGIFVQDNEKVTRSFLEIILDYIDVVEEQQLDVKMGKYLVAYYKVINYLYEFHNYYSMSLDKLKILYDNLSRIEEFINSKNLIQKKKGADNENILNINNNNSQTIDNSLMKDFVIQLKRIGESNYKFYETQKPGKEGQASNNNDNSKGGDVQEAQPVQDNSTVTANATTTATATATDTTTIKSDNSTCVEKMGDVNSGLRDNKEMPVLLGSLIYDEHWFKSTIDDE